jgi:hypothetical protein
MGDYDLLTNGKTIETIWKRKKVDPALENGNIKTDETSQRQATMTTPG